MDASTIKWVNVKCGKQEIDYCQFLTNVSFIEITFALHYIIFQSLVYSIVSQCYICVW